MCSPEKGWWVVVFLLGSLPWQPCSLDLLGALGWLLCRLCSLLCRLCSLLWCRWSLLWCLWLLGFLWALGCLLGCFLGCFLWRLLDCLLWCLGLLGRRLGHFRGLLNLAQLEGTSSASSLCLDKFAGCYRRLEVALDEGGEFGRISVLVVGRDVLLNGG